MNSREWIDAYAERLAIAAPTDDELRAILDIAAEAAHSSQRIAGPVACWLCGKSGRSLEDGLALASDVT